MRDMMAWLFPIKKRIIPGKRWISILSRTLHLVGICGLAGAYLYHQPIESWQLFLYLTVVSGLVMSGLEIYTDGIWLLQLRGTAIGIKLLLLSTMIWWFEQPNSSIYFLVIIISGVVSHAPGKVRYFSVWHGRVVMDSSMRKGKQLTDCGG
jgi:hypothetical protein